MPFVGNVAKGYREYWLTEWLIVDEWRYTILGSDTLLYTSNSDLD